MDHNLKYRVLSHDAATPRYTSYPAAPYFQPGFDEALYRGWLSCADSAGGGLSLYVHIPFCARLCYYCGCHTTIANSYDRIAPYIETLIAEIRLVSNALPAPRRLSHLHFGGGSPTMLSPGDFGRLMTVIGDCFNITSDAEIAIEADPRQMGEARIATFAAHGVNRVSLGTQEVDQRILTAVNRPQPFHLTWQAARLCREYGIESINLDIMYGLPGQTAESIRRTLETALTARPDRIAFFGYAHVPWMKKHMSMMDDLPLPDSDLRYDLYQAGAELLRHAGYLPVGIDHFVRPSDSMARALGNRRLRRNFQGYTTDQAETLIGVGASSIGHLRGGYIQNIADLRLYAEAVADGRLPVNKGLAVPAIDRAHGAVISEIMCYMATDVTRIAYLYGLKERHFDDCLLALRPLVADGLVDVAQGHVRVLHPHVARLAARAFDRTVEAQKGRHSRAV